MRSRLRRPGAVALAAGIALLALACTSESTDPAATSDVSAPLPTRPLPLGADESLAVGETRRIRVDILCGVESLGVAVNEQTWRAIDLADTDATPEDPVPSAWRIEGFETIDLFVTLLDVGTLEAAPWDNDVTVTYSPDPDVDPGSCD